MQLVIIIVFKSVCFRTRDFQAPFILISPKHFGACLLPKSCTLLHLWGTPKWWNLEPRVILTDSQPKDVVLPQPNSTGATQLPWQSYLHQIFPGSRPSKATLEILRDSIRLVHIECMCLTLCALSLTPAPLHIYTNFILQAGV